MKIAVTGCAGRMGVMLMKQILAAEGCSLTGGTERTGSDTLDVPLARLTGDSSASGAVTDDAPAVFAEADAVIDFTAPEATAAHARLAAERGAALVIGTTGMGPEHQKDVDEAAKSVPIVQAGNMSLGVNLLVGLAEQVAAALDENFDIEIVEMHHNQKVDAPSGTALMLGRGAARGRGVDHDARAVLSREGHMGGREKGSIGYAALRGGSVIGEHTIMFAGPGERVEITHKAASREIFANGAVTAAKWCDGRAPGLYSMRDVLGLN